ncbi:MAG: enoyl-ACP reductase [Rhodococcus sp.]|nr:enoyl-ACP reductase [Rhodococcus sp. (in: high G+C Gram-positive bacteria)]
MSERELDIVVYGATGFVGKLLAAYLAEHAPTTARIALGGRSRDKLEAVRSTLPTAASSWPIVVADADDGAALDALAARTRVVATTVGPYAKYGRELVRACAEAGTDYVDLSGEVLFARATIDAHHETAQSSGARIVHSCGFDSIPSDLGVHILHKAVADDGAGELTDTTLVVSALRGGASGGTIDSLRNQIDETRDAPDLRRIAAGPYSLSPDRSAEPDLGRQSDMSIVKGADIAPEVRGWKIPFVMGPANTRVVRRTNSLREWAYGRGFRYREVMSVGSSALSPAIAVAVTAGIGVGMVGMALRPTRAVLDRLLPKPGEGPNEAARENGHFTMDVYTTTTTGARYASRVKASGDPGYKATAVMLGESALSLAFDRAELPEAAGVLTPATAMGDVLVDRLRRAGFELSARRM